MVRLNSATNKVASNPMTGTKNTPFIKPSDAISWSLCARRVWLDNKADFELTPVENAFEKLVIDLGLTHEQAVLQRLSGTLTVHTATSPEDTCRLIAENVPVVYQAQLVDEVDELIGFPDFLILDESGEYQAEVVTLNWTHN